MAERNLAFHGTERPHDPNNGNFLGQVELLAKFDSIMNEHLRRIETREIADHYFSKDIQNKLIARMRKHILQAILEKVNQAFWSDHGQYTRHQPHCALLIVNYQLVLQFWNILLYFLLLK